MKVNLKDIAAVKREFESVQLGFNSLHDDMQTYLDGYQHNFYYAPKANTSNVKVGVNLVQVFADKLWHYTSEFPKINVPSSPEDAEAADKREKILFSTHQKNNSDILWGEWAFDGGVMAACVARTEFNISARCVDIYRYDPRRCYWQKADAGGNTILAFWTAVPMAKTAIKNKYGITPTGSEGMVYDLLADYGEVPMDNEDYYLVVTRDDATHSLTYTGSTFLKRPYKHLQGVIPVDVAMPYKIATYNNTPAFYLFKLKDLQAEFNELWRRRANIVRKLGNPLVYGRGIYKSNEQDIREQLSMDGGFVPLKENGELAVLTIPETKMVDNALNDCFQRMKDAAGFPTATFGEVVGANTSGDALGMYFTPTQKMINHYNKAYKAFLQGINAKILRAYDSFAKNDEEFTLTGYMPNGSMRTLGANSEYKGKGQGYKEVFTKADINGNYTSVVTPAAVTPKDDIAYKRFILDSVTNKFMSRRTGLDEIGIISPEDEFKSLQEEQADPMMNPEGAKAVQGFDPNAQLQNEQGQSPFEPQALPKPEDILSGA
jgi:hypothetical protein